MKNINVKASKEMLYVVVAQYLEIDGDSNSMGKIKTIVCKDSETAKVMEEALRKIYPPTQLCGVTITMSPLCKI